MPKLSPAARARKIKLILFDVDGVLTDGKIWIFPAPGDSQPGSAASASQSASLIEAKGFHAHDGTAIMLARMAGIKTGIITKRNSETVALRARDLKIDHVHQGIQDKASVFAQILQKDGITAAEAAFVGDDVTEAHWTTAHAGGDGAARDAVEYILKAQGKWRKVVEEYVSLK
ncbi:MAG: phosphatase [Terriglobales bacterium]